MPILTNPRHEKFALALSEGKSASEAYELAGYKACRQNAARLMTNDDIQARLAELQAAAAKASEVTIQSLLGELEEARKQAVSLEQLSAAVRAIEAKGKISGITVQRHEIGGVGAFEDCETPAAVVDAMLDEQGYGMAEEDRAELTKLFVAQIVELGEFIKQHRKPLVINAQDVVARERRRLVPPMGPR